MITSIDEKVLNEACKNSRMASEAIKILLPKVYDQDLEYDLQHHLEKYQEFEEKAVTRLLRMGTTPEKESMMQKVFLWSGVQANTVFDISTEHIAQILIQGNTRGMTNVIHTLHRHPNARRYSCEVAKELMDFEEKAIHQLQDYL